MVFTPARISRENNAVAKPRALSGGSSSRTCRGPCGALGSRDRSRVVTDELAGSAVDRGPAGRLLMLVVMLVAAGFAFWDLDAESVWFDEAWSVSPSALQLEQ